MGIAGNRVILVLRDHKARRAKRVTRAQQDHRVHRGRWDHLAPRVT